MKSMNVSDAKSHFSSLVDAVEKGTTILICRRNLPVAQIAPVVREKSAPRHRTVLGWAKNTGVRILGDLTKPAIPARDWEMLR